MILWRQLTEEVIIAILSVVLKLLACAGNDKIHLLTSDKNQRLLVHLKDWESGVHLAEYDDFRVGSEKTNYTLHSLGKFTNTKDASQYVET